MKRIFINILISAITAMLLATKITGTINNDKYIDKARMISNVDIVSRSELIKEMLKEIKNKPEEVVEVETIEEIEIIEEVEEIEETQEEMFAKEIVVELTGYCDCAYCCGIETGITAMGTHTRVGVIAVPQELELGTEVYIPLLTPYKSDGVFYGEDRGGAIIRKSDGTFVLDVWFPTHEQALEFGRRTTVAYLK